LLRLKPRLRLVTPEEPFFLQEFDAQEKLPEFDSSTASERADASPGCPGS
jgi:hypothetical protein